MQNPAAVLVRSGENGEAKGGDHFSQRVKIVGDLHKCIIGRKLAPNNVYLKAGQVAEGACFD